MSNAGSGRLDGVASDSNGKGALNEMDRNYQTQIVVLR
jgi:hypothetical protein